jgi:hypothetical protein
MDYSKIYCTSFCNKGHLLDGRPVDHECYVIPPEMLKAEMEDRFEDALEIQVNWVHRKTHKGVNSTGTAVANKKNGSRK